MRSRPWSVAFVIGVPILMVLFARCGGGGTSKPNPPPPTPAPTPTPFICSAGPEIQTLAERPVVFDGRASTSPNGISAYNWDFGDSTSDTGVTPTHTYKDFSKNEKKVRSYTVTLTITDR